MEKILTVVIPTYNMEKYLRRCLDSLIIEDDKLFNLLEVLIINDGSKDSSSAIAHEYQEKYSEVFRVIDKENGNYGSCVNRGLKEAEGKYIKILDADDWFENRAFKDYLDVLNEVDADLIINGYNMVDSQHNRIVPWYGINLLNKGFSSFEDFSKIQINWPMHGIAYKTKKLRSINYNQTEGISYTDMEWDVIPMQIVDIVYNTNAYLYNYLVGRDGQTMDLTIRRNNFHNLSKVMTSLVTCYNNYNGDDVTKKYYFTQVFIFLRTIYFDTIVLGIYSLSELQAFDDKLKNFSPLIYEELGDMSIRLLFNFRLIKCWRSFESAWFPRIVRLLHIAHNMLRKLKKMVLF